MRQPFLLLCLSSLTVSAQPVLEYGNVDLIGNTYPVHRMTSAGTADLSLGGANVTWDFSSATLQMNLGTISYVDPSTTPDGSSFPSSNMAQESTLPTGTAYDYFNLQTTQLDQLAEGIGGSDETIYTDPKTPLVFPFNYQDSFVDNYNDGSPQSVTRTYSGYGTLILPTGTYTNVVKVSNSSGEAEYFSAEPFALLMDVNDDGTGVVLGDDVSGVAEQEMAPALHAWPNPATDAVSITGVRAAGTWQLIDAEGRTRRHGRMAPGVLSLSLEALVPGCYGVVLQNPSGHHSLLVVKE